ncbi:Asp/Glu/hydantoin racemase [Mycolicibacterium mageritense DSM 44476 = CIP 104973]|uniref:Arylsulfatase n=2 Tax=Mycolicibacterium mageritense TaxID=53462 RepID=A0ABM7HUQ6_MYCME|nr:aspartate/glutamate racemase family protein [Mycolicibacterium mageritense]MCC9181806.1 aspartate/glutamate racemase family protein [Mycolicibacterium mageritense]BBX34313.1 arylsulfatase [Mycolicibacterium mageritense]GJJ18792.1 arylsulfatase [Mycolicibacterium mageritense]
MPEAMETESHAAPPRVVLLHATPVAMAPIHEAFAERWPEAELVDLLDTGLTIDRARTTALTSRLIDRFVSFAEYGHLAGASGILATCSAFGPAIELAGKRLPIPVMKPNEAMFRAALGQGTRIAMLATFAPAVASMSAEFAQMSRDGELHTVVVEEAIHALRRGDVAHHNRLVAGRAADLGDYDAIMLAHFSTSHAATEVRAAVNVPVFTAPESAVLAIRAAVAKPI